MTFSRVIFGKDYTSGAPASLDMRRDARLTIYGGGRVVICRGARFVILNGGHLEIGGETAINCNVAITCAGISASGGTISFRGIRTSSTAICMS